MLGFDAYADIARPARRRRSPGGRSPPHTPRDRRTLLPISPVAARRPRRGRRRRSPGHAWLPPASARCASTTRPVAYLKLASGCDRRCTFCAIPSFRGSFVSRPPADVLAEARWLAAQGVRELVLVSENSTSYGKDLGDLRALEKLLPAAGRGRRASSGSGSPTCSRPSCGPALLEAIADDRRASRRTSTCPSSTPAPTVLRRMKPLRLDRRLPRAARPGPRARAGRRRPQQRHRRLPGRDRGRRRRARALPHRGPAGRGRRLRLLRRGRHRGRPASTASSTEDEIADRVARITALAEELTAQRAEDRIGERVEVLVEDSPPTTGPGVWLGHAAHQGPDVDGTTTVAGVAADAVAGQLVPAEVVGTEGVDLVARASRPQRVTGSGRR